MHEKKELLEGEHPVTEVHERLACIDRFHIKEHRMKPVKCLVDLDSVVQLVKLNSEVAAEPRNCFYKATLLTKSK